MEVRKCVSGEIDRLSETGKRVTFAEMTTASDTSDNGSNSSSDIIEPPEEFRVQLILLLRTYFLSFVIMGAADSVHFHSLS
jgi:hypothetical protein